MYLPTYDANGNVSEYVSTSGEVVAHYDYSPFGKTLIQSGDLADTFTHRFSTKPWCHVTGLSEYQLRMYRPDIERWLSRDPIEEKGGFNLTLFCSNLPLCKVDIIGNDNWGPPPPWGGGNQNAPAIPPGMRYEYPRNHVWDSLDAVMQFYFGNGGSFSLNEIGHYEIVTKNVNEAVKYWEFQQIDKIRRIGKMDLSCQGFTLGVIFGEEYQGMRSGVYWIGGIALKKQYFCKAELDCSSCRVNYECKFDYFMNDPFSDPYDVFNLFPGEINIGGTPFNVTGEWHNLYYGGFNK